jgi:hypothetical protein
VIGCSTDFGAAVGEAAADVVVVVLRRHCGIGLGRRIRSFEGR